MKTIDPTELPGFKKYSHRRWFYVQGHETIDVGAIMRAVCECANKLQPDVAVAMIEERAQITLPTGERLQGMSFKTIHPSVEDGIREYARINAFVYGELDGDMIELGDGRKLPLNKCNCVEY